MPMHDCDIAIIGGGIQGLFTAYLASLRWPECSIRVFESSDIAGGASRFAPGIQLAFGRNQAERDLSRKGQLAWDQMFADWGWRAGRKLPLHWVTSNAESIKLSATEELTVSEHVSVASRALRLDAGQQVFCGTCSYDPVAAVVEQLKGELIKRGTWLHEKTSVYDITSKREWVILMTSGGERITCRNVIVAVGPWVTRSPLGFLCQSVRDIKIKKVVALMLRAKPELSNEAVGLADDYAFLLPMVEKGKWLFSFASEEWDTSPDEPLAINSRDLDKAQSILRRYDIEPNFDIDTSPCFCDAYAPDGLPCVVTADNDPRISFVLGAGGNGFRFAPPLAEQALQQIAH